MPSSRSIVARVTVVAVHAISPTFVRIEFGSPELAEVGVDGPIYDQRIKLIFPGASGLPPLEGNDDWYDQWSRLPERERGAMRTYSIRALQGDGVDRRLVVDFVLHLRPGATGPASSWASQAVVGDQVIVIGPRRGVAWGGIEFGPGVRSRILLAGDETAVPAMTRILGDLPADAVGDAFLEVPYVNDILAVAAPAGFELYWLPRGPADVGTELVPAVRKHFGPSTVVKGIEKATDADEAVDDTIWETPTFSSAGEELTAGGGVANLYAWIAGESGMVTTIRRHLVNQVGIARGQVAFMGYWRAGVAMRG